MVPVERADLRVLGVDRGALVVVADLDTAGLGFFGHRDREPQDAVVVVGLDLVGIEVFPEEQLPAEHPAGRDSASRSAGR